MIVIYALFIILLAYDIHCRKVEKELNMKGYPNPYIK